MAILSPRLLFRRSAATAPLGLRDFKLKLDVVVDDLYSAKILAANDIDPEYGELLSQMHDFIGRGGKRLRPYLTYLAYYGYGGNDEASILHVAAALELYHNAWLIHDDIIDRDLLRYGGPNISGKYTERFSKAYNPVDARHLADSMALLAGDVNIIIAAEQILTSRFSDALKLKVLSRAQKLNFELAGGEQLDVLMPSFAQEDVTLERLMKVCRYKTASYTFEAPLQIGAILAGRDERTVQKISEVAIPMGIAFQLADDLLGTFGNESELGKPVLTDLREGKRTLLVLLAYEQATADEKITLDKTIGNTRAGYRHLEQVRTIMERTKARARTEKMARQQMDLAVSLLPDLEFTPKVEAEIRRLADFSLRRQS